MVELQDGHKVEDWLVVTVCSEVQASNNCPTSVALQSQLLFMLTRKEGGVEEGCGVLKI